MRFRSIFNHRRIIISLFTMVIVVASCLSNANKNAQDSPEIPQKILSDEQLMEEYNKLRKELNLTTVIEGIEGYSQKGILYKKGYNDTFDCWAAKISGAVGMVLGLKNGQALKIFNGIVLRKLYHGKDEPKDSSEVKPMFNKGEVIKKVERYRQIIESNQKYKCKLTEAEFIKQGNWWGNWSFRWRRYYDKYRYYQDVIEINFNEIYGLLSYVNHCISDIPSNIDVKISEHKAQEIALEYAKEIISSNKFSSILGVSFKRWFNNFKIENIISTELLIVNPNYLLTNKSTWGSTKRTREARLAWNITVEVKYTGKIGPKGEYLPDKKIFIWIDASTGEMLGGDFTL